ncbi:hypothetical protein HGM15179_019299 [Zosterops borbonicus]|uniref:Uncharacterized protein n=1 Tax=Zosterops borbonicus TaxID=364589 RepID=A0A8K1FYP4_9PASS|nr:hypothetical protein HGM15179_019299 [Zosterops borbonicus]
MALAKFEEKVKDKKISYKEYCESSQEDWDDSERVCPKNYSEEKLYQKKTHEYTIRAKVDKEPSLGENKEYKNWTNGGGIRERGG